MSVSRRTIAKGAAWAVPVIAVGAAAPLAAASGPPPVIVQASGLGCKEPGKSFSKDSPFAYRLSLEVTTSFDDTVTLIGCTVPSGDPAVAFLESSHEVFVVGNPNPIEVRVASTNSANGTAVLTFSYSGGTVPVAVEFGDGFNPCPR